MKKIIAVGLAGLLLPIMSSCGGSSWTYSSRSYEPQEWKLLVNKPKTALADDFAWGVDVSSLKEVENGGGKFYDLDGTEKDVFKILNDGGANYARFRLWNDPYDANGKPYGGGTNDLKTDIELAKRAQAAGMQILIDFHYSDSWVDPGKYWSPKAWKTMEFEEKSEALAEFTRKSLQAFKDAGVTVSSVQLGNEINPGIAGIGANNYQRISAFIASGRNATKAVFPQAKTIVHYTNVSTQATQILTWLERLQKYNALPDVVGFSYYPFWHGSLDNLQKVLDSVATTFGTEVMVMETSWGFTDDPAGDRGCNNQFSSATLGEAGGYATSTQAQATVVGDIVNVLSKVPNKKGTGIFYWEPAWLPNFSSGWIKKEGAYYNDTGKDWVNTITQADLDERYGGEYCYSSWANQGWFDYNGHVLPSAYTYRHIITGDHQAEEAYQQLYKSEIDITANLSDPEWKMPSTARVVTNLGAYREAQVVWNNEEIAVINKPGHFVVHGKVGSYDLTANVTALKNYIQDPDFQKQGCKTESAVVDPWKIVTTKAYKADIGDAHIEAKSEMGGNGNQYLHWYSTSDFEFDLYQDLGTVEAGTYDFGFSMLSSYYDNDAGSSVLASTLYYKVGDEVHPVDIRTEHKGYGAGAHDISYGSEIVLDEACEVRIGFTVKATGKAWGHADDFYFSAVIDE